ncbi:MAG: enoyl-CoA hydratase/isomerase family protein [Candidatus Hydrogenedentota bacterium]
MSDEAVLYEIRDQVAVITLNRPENRNSMTKDVLAGIVQRVQEIRENPDLRCVVITGKGSSFCAGADFKSGIGNAIEGSQLQPNERSFKMYQPFLSILDIEVPVIGALNGHAIGGGLGLALVCDIRVANEKAKYGSNFTKLGLHPGMATTYFLPRFVGVPRAAELLLTGRIITGAEAADYGLMNYALPAEEVWDKAWSLAEEVASCAPLANRWTKQSLYQNVDWDPIPAARHEADLQSRTITTKDHKEGVEALLQKRKPEFKNE